MKISAFIIGNKVALRTLCPKDVAGPYSGWFNDAEVCRYNFHHRFPYYQKQAARYIEEVIKSRNDLVLAVVTKKTGVHIGNISLQKIDHINRTAEFAIIIGDKRYWGKGYAGEAARLLIKHGFQELNLNRIYCGTSSENLSMQKLAISLGMKREGRRRQAVFKAGRYSDMLEYGLLRKEYIRGSRNE